DLPMKAERIRASDEMASILAQLKRRKAQPKPDPDWLTINQAIGVLARALSIPDEVAYFTLIGLMASERIRARDLLGDASLPILSRLSLSREAILQSGYRHHSMNEMQ